MSYQIKFSKRVFKFLEKSNQSLLKKFDDAVRLIKENPYTKVLDIKKVKWKKWHYRLRIWKYRFLYEVREKEILIYFYEVDSRWDIYKKL